MLNADLEANPEKTAAAQAIAAPTSVSGLLKAAFSLYGEIANELIIQWFLRLALPFAILFALLVPLCADFVYGLIYIVWHEGIFSLPYYIGAVSHYMDSFEITAAGIALLLFAVIWFYQSAQYNGISASVVLRGLVNNEKYSVKGLRVHLLYQKMLVFVVRCAAVIFYLAVFGFAIINLYGVFLDNPLTVPVLVGGIFVLASVGFVLFSLWGLCFPAAVCEGCFGSAAISRSFSVSWKLLPQVLIIRAISCLFLILPGFGKVVNTILYYYGKPI